MKIIIKRQKNNKEKSYWQTFEYSNESRVSVAQIIDAINSNLKNDEKIQWDCSCMQKKCGACAMVINGVPDLACEYFVNTSKTKELKIEPLSKFPVVCDLVVDRSVILQKQEECKIFRKSDAIINEKEFDYQYNAAKCLKCGLCLEICPNYMADGKHFGAVMLHENYLIASSSPESRQKMIENFREHFEKRCSACMSCRQICPVKISTLASSTYFAK